MKKTIELCRPCAEKRKERTDTVLVPILMGIDKKIWCDDCHRRRFGSEYEIKEVRK